MVAIKDFGMPSCCNNCDMVIGEYGNWECAITSQNLNADIAFEQRNDNCPLVEIKENEDGQIDS